MNFNIVLSLVVPRRKVPFFSCLLQKIWLVLLILMLLLSLKMIFNTTESGETYGNVTYSCELIIHEHKRQQVSYQII